jgi:hypothetical protein
VKNHVIKFKTKKKEKAPKLFNSGAYLKSPFVRTVREETEGPRNKMKEFAEKVRRDYSFLVFLFFFICFWKLIFCFSWKSN